MTQYSTFSKASDVLIQRLKFSCTHPYTNFWGYVGRKLEMA